MAKDFTYISTDLAERIHNIEKRLESIEEWIAGHKEDIKQDMETRKHIVKTKQYIIDSLESFQKSLNQESGLRTDEEITQHMEMYKLKLMDMIKSNLEQEKRSTGQAQDKKEGEEPAGDLVDHS